jgi:hypothetical protein
MDNQAQKWLTEWLNFGHWGYDSIAGVWCLALIGARSGSSGIVGFRKDLRQLLADAEAGRKLREGV